MVKIKIFALILVPFCCATKTEKYTVKMFYFTKIERRACTLTKIWTAQLQKKLVWRCEFNVGGWKVQLSLELFFKKSNLKYPPQTLIAEHRWKVMNASNKTIIFLFFLDNLLRVDSDGLGGVVCLVDADKPVGELEHVRPQWYDDKLGIAGSLLDVVCNDRNVLEVQSGVDLVHDVQRRRFIVVKSKHLLGNVRSVTKLFKNW